MKRFINIEKRFRNNNILFSLANSNGSVLSKKFLFNMIRPGIALYGGSNKNKLLAKKLRPVVTLSGKVIQIKIINKNEYIGYNQTYKTSKKITVAIVGIGYADGMPRILSNIGEVYFKKDKYKIIGRISMDSFTIDISKTRYNIKVGTYIDLINSKYGIKDFAKVSAQPKVNNGFVYFPIYRPSKSVNKCDLGDAFICAVDDECGTHDSFLGLENSRSEQSGSKCRFVGKGVLSEIVLL